MTRSINFVSKAGPHLGSHRMRCEIPSRLLNESKEDISAVVIPNGSPAFDVNVFTKHFNPQEMLDEAHYCKDKGSTIVYDICDNHFNRDAAPIYKAMCEIAHRIVCNTPRMQEKIKEYTGKDAHIVPDPITFPFRIPEVKREGKLKILFFGHSSNMPPLLSVAERLPDERIIAVTNMPRQPVGNNLQILPWSLGLVEAIIPQFDIVLIPQKGQRFWVKDKSPNRAVDSIHSGKFVITDTPEIYGCLEDYLYIGDIVEGIQYYKDTSKDLIYSKIRDGQKFIQKEFGHEKVLNEWLTVLT